MHNYIQNEQLSYIYSMLKVHISLSFQEVFLDFLAPPIIVALTNVFDVADVQVSSFSLPSRSTFF